MCDDLNDLVLGDAVVERAMQVAAQLVGAVERGERRDRDQAAIALGGCFRSQTSPSDLVADLAKLGEHVLDLGDRGRWRLRGHETPFL